MKKQNIYHKNIKASNILLKRNNIRITDFLLSKILQE